MKEQGDSAGNRLGMKVYGGQAVQAGDIIARQRGFKWHPGENVHYGRDHTIHASVEGIVTYTRDPYRRRKKTFIHVLRQENPNTKLNNPPPFVYHPELYPTLAENNPSPIKFEIPRPGKKPRQRNPVKLGVRAANRKENSHFTSVILDQKHRLSGGMTDLAVNDQPEYDQEEVDIAEFVSARSIF